MIKKFFHYLFPQKSIESLNKELEIADRFLESIRFSLENHKMSPFLMDVLAEQYLDTQKQIFKLKKQIRFYHTKNN